MTVAEVKVIVEVVVPPAVKVTAVGAYDAVSPAGELMAVRTIPDPEKPPRLVRVMVAVPELEVEKVTVLGLTVIEKS